MDKESQEKSMSVVVGPSKDGEPIFNWHKQEPNEQNIFPNNLIKIGSNVENSTENNVNKTLQEELKSMDDRQEEIIFQLLFNDASIYDKNANGETFLLAAFKEGCYDALRSTLTNLTPNFNPTNKDDVLHFHIACVTNHYVAAEKFLKCGLDPNSPISLDYAEYSGLNPMEFAIQNNYYELFVTLLKYNGDLSRKNAKGLTPLHTFYYSNCPNNRRSWIQKAFEYGNDKTFINPEDRWGIQHFHLCCMVDNPNFIQTFIDNGANVNNQVSLTCPLNPGFTPLHFAVLNDCIIVTELLLKSGADPNIPDKEGKTPLHLAAKKIDRFSSCSLAVDKVISILLDYNANPIITDMNGYTPLHISFYKATFVPFNDDEYYSRIVQLIVETLIFGLRHNWGSNNYTDEQGLSLFHIACTKNLSTPILNFLNSGVNINSRVSSGMYSGYTALHFSVMSDHYNHYQKQKVLQILLESGAKVNEKEDKFGYTPLGLVCEKLQYSSIAKLIPLLLKYEASTVIADKKGRTPLHKCFYSADELGFGMFDTLISKTKWDSNNCTDDHGLSLFHIACTTNDVGQVTKFLNSGVNINSRVSSGMYEGFTALHFAVMHNQKEVVEILLKRNINVNDRASKLVATPLHLACELNSRKFKQKYKCCSNQIYIIKLLILHGAEIDAKDSCGMTPLLFTCMIDNSYQIDWSNMIRTKNVAIQNTLHYDISARLQKVVTILISNKADVNARTKDQFSVLHIISKYKILKNSEKLVKLFLLSGLDVNVLDAAGLTPLHSAVYYGNNNLLKSLLNHNANPNITSINSCRTPLHTVVDHIIYRFDKSEFLEEMRDTFFILLENGGDVHIEDAYGTVILHEAMRARKYFLIDDLLKYGADINVDDSNGNCSFTYLFERSADKNLWIVLRLIFFHLKWREALKLPISPKVQKYCEENQLYTRCETNLQEHGEHFNPNENYIQCCAELDVLKNIQIDSFTSLYDILKKDPHELIKHVKNVNLIKIATDENLYEKFPLYGYLLKRQIKRGIKRSEVTESADTILREVLNINLPDLCCDSVLKNLTNEEVANLVKSAPIKRN